jgi:excisionase family DNA binding protein
VLKTMTTSISKENCNDGPVYPSVDRLAEELGICRRKAYEGLRNGEIPSIRLGKRFVLPRAAIEAWLRSAGRSSV